MPSSTETDAVQAAIADLRDELRAAGDRRAAAIAAREQADQEIADLAIRAKGSLPMDEIAQLGRFKTRKAIYDLIAWRTGSKPDRH